MTDSPSATASQSTAAATDPATGLSAAEVADRVARGLNNAIPSAPTRTVGQIVKANVGKARYTLRVNAGKISAEF